MNNNLNFLIEASKLKEMPRTGWIIWRIKSPESIADHIFRVAILSWLLSEEKKLETEKSIKDALSHDICEVYAGDITPLFYYQNLNINRKRDKEILMKGIRLSQEEKKKRSKVKFKKEKTSLLKLVSSLDENIKNEIFTSWLDYEQGFSFEGKFTKQIDWIENLLQSLEYLGVSKSGSGWWEIAEEKVYDPFLLDFLKVIQQRFYHNIKNYRSNKKLEGILEFILEVGKLKSLPRLYWRLLGIKKPETVAGHIFSLSIAVWVLGSNQKDLNTEKLLKMALCHELSAIYTNDTTPYDPILPKQKQDQKKVLSKMLHISQSKKEEIFKKEYNEEKRALEKLTKNLQPKLRAEIIQLWKEYRTRSSPEGNFLNQLNSVIVLLQGIIFKKEYKQISLTPLWEWVYEKCDHPVCLQFLDDLKKIK